MSTTPSTEPKEGAPITTPPKEDAPVIPEEIIQKSFNKGFFHSASLVDEALAANGYQKPQGEHTSESVLKFAEMRAAAALEEYKKSLESQKKPSEGDGEQANELYMAKIKEAERKAVEIEQAYKTKLEKLQAESKRREVELMAAQFKIAVPESLDDESRKAYEKEMRALLVERVSGLPRKEIDGEVYYLDDSGSPMMRDDMKPLPLMEVASRKFSYMIAKEEQNKPSGGLPQQEKRSLSEFDLWKDKDSPIDAASSKHVVGSAEWFAALEN